MSTPQHMTHLLLWRTASMRAHIARVHTFTGAFTFTPGTQFIRPTGTACSTGLQRYSQKYRSLGHGLISEQLRPIHCLFLCLALHPQLRSFLLILSAEGTQTSLRHPNSTRCPQPQLRTRAPYRRSGAHSICCPLAAAAHARAVMSSCPCTAHAHASSRGIGGGGGGNMDCRSAAVMPLQTLRRSEFFLKRDGS